MSESSGKTAPREQAVEEVQVGELVLGRLFRDRSQKLGNAF
jgi:hypothetical protein